MDPFSTSVNVLTMLNIACESSIVLYKLLRGMRTAPIEIACYCTLLKGLNQTFSTLGTLHSEETIRLQLSRDFPQRLGGCLVELQNIQHKIQVSMFRMQDGLLRKSWEMIKWSISSEASLGKCFARLQMYYMEFSMELHGAQL